VAAVVSEVPSANWMAALGPLRIKLPLIVWLVVNVLGAVVIAAPVGIGPAGP
jgi:hypothetical protein